MINSVRYIAYDGDNEVLSSEDFYSVGGGFVIHGDPSDHNAFRMIDEEDPNLTEYDKQHPPYPFETAEELLRLCRAHECNISEICRKNEQHWRTDEEVTKELENIWNVMNNSIQNGITTKGLLQTKAKRRAANMYEKLRNGELHKEDNPLNAIAGPHYDDWVCFHGFVFCIYNK